MKKKYTTAKYKSRQKVKQKKGERRKRNRKPYDPNRHPHNIESKIKADIKEPIMVPKDFRLLEETESCLDFFSKLRNLENLSTIGRKKFVELIFKEVEQIDYSSISVLTAIIDDFNFKKIILRTDFPVNQECRDFIIQSGFLDNMYDQKGKPFPKSKASDTLFFEKGMQKLSREENIRISKTVKKVMEHVTGKAGYCQAMRTILLEICGNSIEWADTENKQWLLGVKYEDQKAIITVTDVGKGILNTLHRKFGQKLSDMAGFKSDDKILEQAFDKKYGSKSKKSNRNKGLPFIKNKFEGGKISELKVITNNVILHFDNQQNSRELNNYSLDGTFYRWVVTTECFNN